MTDSVQQKSKLAKAAGIASVASALVLIVIKGIAAALTGSVTMLTSLVDSVIDAGTSATNLWAINYSAKPADHDHRHGHGKIEGVVALFQAAFIFGASIVIILEAVERFFHPDKIESHGIGLILTLISIVVAAALVTFQTIVARKTKSLAVEADRAHYLGDGLLYAAMIASLVADQRLGWAWVDPVLAIICAAWMMIAGVSISRKALDMLLDRELEDGERQTIRDTIITTSGVVGVHDLRTRRSGLRVIIDFDIEVAADLSLKDAHDIAHATERSLLALHPDAEIMIHVDPVGQPEDSRHQNIKAMHVS